MPSSAICETAASVARNGSIDWLAVLGAPRLSLGLHHHYDRDMEPDTAFAEAKQRRTWLALVREEWPRGIDPWR
jgi:hypothetical protein